MKEYTTRKIYNVWSYFYDMLWPTIVPRSLMPKAVTKGR